MRVTKPITPRAKLLLLPRLERGLRPRRLKGAETEGQTSRRSSDVVRPLPCAIPPLYKANSPLAAYHRPEVADRAVAREGVVGLVGLLQSLIGGFAESEEVEVEAEQTCDE